MRLVLLFIVTSLLLFGCTRQNPPAANNAAPQPSQAPNQTQRVQQTAPETTLNQSPQAKADRLVQLASRVKNVENATAVVVGNWAVVGIRVNPHLDRPDVGVIKYSVAEALKADPQGASAIVTADPGIVQRLREMNADIQAGRPIVGITEELGDIVGRIIPQLPQNVQQREQPPNKQNEQRINKSGKAEPHGNQNVPIQR